MTLYPRTADAWQSEQARDKAWAHSVLDHLKAGDEVDEETINSALRLTGDLLEGCAFDAFERLRKLAGMAA